MQVTKKTILVVSFTDLDTAIQKFLSKKLQRKVDYESIAEEEWNNGTTKMVTVKPQLPEQYYLDKWKNGDYRGVSHILNWMCKEKEISPGEYGIEIYW